MVDVAEHMLLITQEARRMRRELPKGHPIEVSDLVSAGAAHVLEYLRMSCDAGPACVRVYARHGMLAEVRRWDHGTRKHPVHVAALLEVDDRWLRAVHGTPPIELMIDLLRAILALGLRDALAWTSRRLCDNDHEVSARELREASSSQRNRVTRSDRALRETLHEYEPRPAKTTHQRAVELFQQGASCAFVAKTLHTSEVKAAAIQDSIDPLAKERRAALAFKMRHQRTDVTTTDIIALRRTGLTEQAIADRLGCGLHLVNKRLHKLGLNEGRIDTLRRRGIRPLAKCGL